MKAKIKIRKLRDAWFVFLPGDIPEFPSYRHWSDAVARVQLEIWLGREKR